MEINRKGRKVKYFCYTASTHQKTGSREVVNRPGPVSYTHRKASKSKPSTNDGLCVVFCLRCDICSCQDLLLLQVLIKLTLTLNISKKHGKEVDTKVTV